MNNTWKIYMLTMISFLIGTSQFVIVGILDKVAASTGVSVATAGQLITAFALASAIGTPIVMVVTAKMDRRRQLLLALTIFLLGIVTTLALPGFGFLMASRVILGVGTGVFIVTAYAITARLASPGRRGEAMSNISMVQLGFAAGAGIGGIAVGGSSIMIVSWIGAASVAVALCVAVVSFGFSRLRYQPCGD